MRSGARTLLAQVAAGWVLASVFVRFCEDNGLVATPLLSDPGGVLDVARDHRAEFFAADPTAGDREWLVEVYRRYQQIPATAEIFGDRNPLWQLSPSADGARAILELWWARDAEGRETRHDFTDPADPGQPMDTRFYKFAEVLPSAAAGPWSTLEIETRPPSRSSETSQSTTSASTAAVRVHSYPGWADVVLSSTCTQLGTMRTKQSVR